MSVVRYGNVLGSRGSVLAIWKKLLDAKANTLPITDKRMTRFWITLEQAADFVIDNFNRMRGGEIYVPKIPSMHIEDLAEAFAPGIKRSYIGIREGEKLHELMVGVDDSRHTLEYDDHYMIIPDTYFHYAEVLKRYLEGRQGNSLPDGFSYTSDKNTQWLNVQQLRELILA
jgi:UDP-N-acetylglucosamine 4,6-dehydratase